jgi:hypothetical protein
MKLFMILKHMAVFMINIDQGNQNDCKISPAGRHIDLFDETIPTNIFGNHPQ